MTIQTAIERAIEGGWKPQNLGFTSGDTKLDGFCIEGEKVIIGASKTYYNEHWKYDERRDGGFWIHIRQVVTYPDFWQALGKVEGWNKDILDKENNCLHCGVKSDIQPPRESGCNHVHYPEACEVCRKHCLDWRDNMHAMIDALAEGKSIEEFFTSLN